MSTSSTLPIGLRVRQRSSGEIGVVVGSLGAEVEVAFPSGQHYVAATDLERLALPAKELAAGRVGDSEAAYLRLLSLLLDHSSRFDPGATLHNARLEPQLHQVFVAHRVVAEKAAPRMILADEVGLGKTIEAGLIIKELRARSALKRVLIIAPASLTTQWQSELETKFNERFDIIDGVAAKHLGRNGANPFAAVDSAICSLPFATHKTRVDQIVEAGWDMVVFDEAHRVRRIGSGSSVKSTTLAYRLAEDLRDHVDGMLLLSATPVQLDPSELFNLIELVEPGLFRSPAAFKERRGQIPVLNELMHAVERWPTLAPAARMEIESRHARLVAAVPGLDLQGLEDGAAREAAKDAIARYHPLAYAMVRNRKRELNLAGERRAELIPVPLTEIERELYEAVSDYIRYGYNAATREKNNAVGFLMVTYQKMLASSSHALRVSFRRRIEQLRSKVGKTAAKGPETTVDVEDPDELSALVGDLQGATLRNIELRTEIEVLTDLANRLDDVRDSKLGRAVRLVNDLRNGANTGSGRKVVIFTQFVETQMALKQTLEYAGHAVSVFNGRQKAEEKDNAVRAFRERADVLVCTEAGGEGRNLQFASALINYDLPWNPMKVEQRIGRLDRIGQTEVVEIFNLVAEDTLEERIVRVLSERIKMFEESVGNLEPILGDLETTIRDLAMASPADQARAFERLGRTVEHEVREARLLEESMKDFVLDRASFRKDRAARLLGHSAIAGPGDLQRVVERGLDYLGGSVMEHSEGGVHVALPPRVASRLGLNHQGYRGVFDPGEAIRRDDLEFFAFGHAFVDRLLKEVRDLPDALVGARRSCDVPPGLWVEVIYRITSRLVVDEAVTVRHLVGEDGVVHSSSVSHMPLGDVPVGMPAPAWAAGAIAASEARFERELAEKRTADTVRFEELRAERIRREERAFDARADRLTRRIIADEEWLEARATGDVSAADRRVMPARAGRLRSQQKELAELGAEREARLSLIAGKPLAISGEVISASLVLGVGAGGVR